MSYFIPSYIQKRLLRYALLRTGLLESDALDLESFDITLGKQNRIELRNVGLHVQKLTSLLHLPDELKLLTARILVLRIVVPADLYNGSIEIDVDDIEGNLTLSDATGTDPEQDARSRTTSTKTPQHRKSNRRLRSPRSFDPGGQYRLDDDDHVPNTEDLAKSFLQEEPQHEKQELEQIYSRHQKKIDESILSEASDSDAAGTGTDLGLPVFLATFLQRLIDRIKVKVHNVVFTLDTPSSPREPTSISDVALRLKIRHIEVGALTESETRENARAGDKGHDGGCLKKRRIDISGALLSMLTPWTEPTPSDADRPSQKDMPVDTSIQSPSTPQMQPVVPAKSESPASASGVSHGPKVDALDRRTHLQSSQSSASTHLAGASSSTRFDTHRPSEESVYAEPQDSFDIQPGEDNLSWTERRSRTGNSDPEIWSDPSSSQNLTVSMLADERHLFSDDMDSHLQDAQSTTFDPQVSGEISLTCISTPREPPGPHSLSEEFSDSNVRKYEEELASSQSSPGEDMSQSRFFDPEEARSMYISAISQRSAQSKKLRGLPGGWDHDDEYEEDSQDGTQHQSSTPDFEEDPMTPKAPSPVTASPSAPGGVEQRREHVIFSIDEITISLNLSLIHI